MQLELFDPPAPAAARARRSDPVESHEAAESVNSAVKAKGHDHNKPSPLLQKLAREAFTKFEPCPAKIVILYVSGYDRNKPNEWRDDDGKIVTFSSSRVTGAMKWFKDEKLIKKVGSGKDGGIYQLTELGREIGGLG